MAAKPKDRHSGRPRLLDLFCGAGGAGKGYHDAGFDVVGVDIEPQPDYPFEFDQADALTFPLDGFDAVHASPPCQAFTSLRHLGKGAGEGALDLVDDIRARLLAWGGPYVIENVLGSPLRNPVMLCGSSFGLGVRRHRLFECNFPVMVPSCLHGLRPRAIAVYGDHPQDSRRREDGDVNRARTLGEGREAMGIDWMAWRPLTQAIPPAFTEHIGGYLMSCVGLEQAA